MSIIRSIRKRARLLVGVMSVALFLFIAQELIKGADSLFRQQPVLGSVDGNQIKLKAFEAEVEKLQHSYLMTYGRAPSETELHYLREHTWQEIINDMMYPKVCKSLGTQVTQDELIDMVQGDHIHPDIQAAFISPQTKTFSKEDLLNTLSNLAKLPKETQTAWHEYEQSLAKKRCREKYQQLLAHSVYVTTLDAEHTWMLDNTVLDIEYVHIPYQQIPDNEEVISDKTIDKYIRDRRDEYAVEENKEIKYIAFPILPSTSDHNVFQEELAELKQAFLQTTEDKLFATTHTDAVADNSVTLTCTKSNLPTELIPYKDQLKKGAVIGPIAIDLQKIYRLYKVTDVGSGKDPQYSFHCLEKHLSYSDETKELCLKQAEECRKNVKSKNKFEAYTQKHGIATASEKVYKDDTRLGTLRQVRPLVRWLYKQEGVDKVSPVLELDDHYVIAVLIKHTRKGSADLEQVKQDVYKRIKNEKKRETLQEALKSPELSSATLQDIATHYGHRAQHNTAEKVRFDSVYTDLPGIGNVRKAIHCAFALAEGQRSSIIGDDSGFILLEVTKRYTQPLPNSWKAQQRHQIKLEQYRQAANLFTGLTKTVSLVDNRCQYY